MAFLGLILRRKFSLNKLIAIFIISLSIRALVWYIFDNYENDIIEILCSIQLITIICSLFDRLTMPMGCNSVPSISNTLYMEQQSSAAASTTEAAPVSKDMIMMPIGEICENAVREVEAAIAKLSSPKEVLYNDEGEIPNHTYMKDKMNSMIWYMEDSNFKYTKLLYNINRFKEGDFNIFDCPTYDDLVGKDADFVVKCP